MQKSWLYIFARKILLILLSLVIAGCQDKLNRVNETVQPPVQNRKIVHSDLGLVEQWRFKTGRPNSSPATFPSHLFVTSDRVVVGYFLDDGKEQSVSLLTAVSLQDGHVLWQTQYQDQQYGTDISSGYLDQETNRLFIFYSFNVSAFDLSTGEMLWTTPQLTTHTSYFFAYESHNPLILNTSSETQIAIDPTTGQILSKKKTNQPSMRVSNGEIVLENSVVNSALAFLALDQDGNLLWAKPGDSAEFWPTFLENGDFIWQHGSGSYSFERTDSRTGEKIWTSTRDYVSNYALMDNTLYALRQSGVLEGLNLENGVRTGSILFDPFITPPRSRPFWVATNGEYLLVYFGDSQELIAFKNE